MELEKENKFAIFLGYKQNKKHKVYPKTTYWFKDNESPICCLLFHTDWNWLFKVIDKIEALELGRFRVKIYFGKCSIYDTKELEEIISYCNDYKIKSVYYALLEFIEWYNKSEK